MANKKGHKANHIPINFVDHKQDSATSEQEGNEQALETRSDEDDLSAEEIGRASGYEDETEVQRRVDRGQEENSERGHDRADDADSAGSAPSDELPERRKISINPRRINKLLLDIQTLKRALRVRLWTRQRWGLLPPN